MEASVIHFNKKKKFDKDILRGSSYNEAINLQAGELIDLSVYLGPYAHTDGGKGVAVN